MTGEVAQIVKSYENLHLSLEDIAKDSGFPVDEIKSVLLQYSVLYRKEMKAGNNFKDYTDEEALAAKHAIVSIMQSTDDDNLKFRAAKLIRDDKLGRKDIAKNMKGLNVNVFLFNEQMKRARISSERTIASSNDTETQRGPAPSSQQDAIEVGAQTSIDTEED